MFYLTNGNVSLTLSLEYRYYLEKILINPKGFYVGGGLKYYNQKDIISYTSGSNSQDVVMVDNNFNYKIVHFILGVQYLPVQYLTIDVHANPGYKIGNGTDVSGGNAGKGGLTCSFYFGIGINF